MSNNCTYIQNPSYPSSYSTSGTCSYSVSPVNDEICQLRLDFDTLDLTESLTTGACTDSFDTTTSSGREYHSLCGTLSGQHGKSIYKPQIGIFTSTKCISCTYCSLRGDGKIYLGSNPFVYHRHDLNSCSMARQSHPN